MLDKVLVGTDLSSPSLAVIDYLPKLLDYGLERIVLAHLVYVVGAEGMVEVLIDQAEEGVQMQAEQLRKAGFEVQTEIRLGASPSNLVQLAEKHKVSAIVVGSQGKSMIQRMLLGSVALSLLHHSTVPVLIIRMDICETEDGINCEVLDAPPLSHLLFPTDFSEGSERAFEYLKSLATGAGSQVTLVHAQDTDAIDHKIDSVEAFNATDRARLEELAQTLRSAGLTKVDTVLLEGAAAQLINSMAEERDASMIVMSTRGRGALGELFLGSVALRVARTSPVPVMLVPQL